MSPVPENQGLGPAIPRRRLGAELRRLRLARDKKLGDVANELLISTSKLSRLEKGHSPAQERDIRDLLAYYDEVGTELGDRMRRWAVEGREEPWWHQTSFAVPPVLEQYVQYETAAERVSIFIMHLVPSLLQTEDYARAIVRDLESADPSETDALVEFRMRRQAVLTRDEYPTHLDCVIDEAALRRQVGSARVMRDQLEELAEASANDRVTLRVLPFTAGPHLAFFEGTFTIFHFRRAIDSDVVNIEGHLSDSYVEGEQVDSFRSLLKDLQARALDPEQTRRFITEIAREFREEE